MSTNVKDPLFLSEVRRASIPEASDYPVLDGAVVNVQSVPADFLNEPLLASLNGGEIPARKDVNGELVPEHGQYQVTIEMNVESNRHAVSHVLRGVVYSDSKPYSLAGYVYDRVRALLSREAGLWKYRNAKSRTNTKYLECMVIANDRK